MDGEKMIKLVYLKEDEAKVVKVHIGRVVNVEGKPGFADYHEQLIRDGFCISFAVSDRYFLLICGLGNLEYRFSL